MTLAQTAPDTAHRRGVFLVAGAATIWSTSGLVARLISADPWTMAFYRAGFASLFLIAYLASRDRSRFGASFVAAGWAGLAVGCCFAATTILFVLSISLTKVANTLILQSLSPLIAALLGWVLLGERVRPRTWMTIFAAVAGVVVMMANAIATGSIVGDLLALIIAFAFATATVLIRRSKAVRMTPAAAMGTAIAMLVALAWAQPLSVAAADLPLLFIFGACQLGLGMALFTAGARLVPAAETSLLAILETVLAPIWVWLLLGETPTGLVLVGGGIVLTALVAHTLLDARDARAFGMRL
jgi:drug/metabolite transporter (DMT)-like permease